MLVDPGKFRRTHAKSKLHPTPGRIDLKARTPGWSTKHLLLDPEAETQEGRGQPLLLPWPRPRDCAKRKEPASQGPATDTIVAETRQIDGSGAMDLANHINLSAIHGPKP